MYKMHIKHAQTIFKQSQCRCCPLSVESINYNHFEEETAFGVGQLALLREGIANENNAEN